MKHKALTNLFRSSKKRKAEESPTPKPKRMICNWEGCDKCKQHGCFGYCMRHSHIVTAMRHSNTVNTQRQTNPSPELLLVEDAQKTAVPNEMHQNSTRRGKLCDQVEYAIHEKKQPQATNVEHISDRAQNGFKANPQEASLKKPPKGVARQSTDNGDVQPSRQVEVNILKDEQHQRAFQSISEARRMHNLPDKSEFTEKVDANKDNKVNETCQLILNDLKHKDRLKLFVSPMDRFAHFDSIPEPMDLSTIQKKLDMNEIESLEEFARLVRLTFENVITFKIASNSCLNDIVQSTALYLLVQFNWSFSYWGGHYLRVSQLQTKLKNLSKIGCRFRYN